MPPETAAPLSLHAEPTTISVDALRPAARNRRTRVDEEFVASVRDNGVIERLVVRPVHDLDLPTMAHTHEIVCGHRRWAAAKLAGLSVVPVDVRELDDAAAAEVAIIENLHRESLTPLEEADAFRWLLEENGRSVDDIAARVHRSTSYVRQRLHLHGLIEPLRRALDEDRLTMDAALLVAQTPERVQRDVAEEVEGVRAAGWREPGHERIGRHDVVGWISGHWRQLREAPFDISDPLLVEPAGACGSCPKRTGTQGILFDCVEVADACLDEECWASKSNESWARKSADAKARGLRVLTDAEAKTILPYGRVASDAPWVALDARAYGSGDLDAPTWREVLGEDVPRAIGRDLSGVVHELAEKRVAQAAAKAAAKESGSKPLKQLAKEVRANERDEKLRGEIAASNKAAKADKDKAAREAAAAAEKQLVEIVTRATEARDGFGREVLLRRIVATLADGVWTDVAQRFVKRRKIDDLDNYGGRISPQEAIARWATSSSHPPSDMIAALAELAILAHDRSASGDCRPDFLADLAAFTSKPVKRKAKKAPAAAATKAPKAKADKKLMNAAAKTGRAKKRAGVR